MLEGLHASEAKVLIDVKNKSLNKTYKGLTSDMVKEVIRLERRLCKTIKNTQNQRV